MKNKDQTKEKQIQRKNHKERKRERERKSKRKSDTHIAKELRESYGNIKLEMTRDQKVAKNKEKSSRKLHIR